MDAMVRPRMDVSRYLNQCLRRHVLHLAILHAAQKGARSIQTHPKVPRHQEYRLPYLLARYVPRPARLV